MRRDEEVGMVRRRAAGLEEGVEGRVGGTRYSKPWARLVVCDFAREDAVVASYRLWGGAPFDPEQEASGWFGSDKVGNDAFLPSRRWLDVGEGLRPECDFWPLRLPAVFAVKKVPEGGGGCASASL